MSSISSLEKAKPTEDGPLSTKNRSAFFAFIKQLGSFKGDLTSITAPPFILSTTSITEYATYWAESPSLLVAPASETDPAKRALLVLRWFLTTLKQQYSHRDAKGGRKKKPLNPFLGELFFGSWHDEAGETKLVSEQVSHHPPTTAYRIWNEQHGVELQGYYSQDVRFRGTIRIQRLGHAVLRLEKWDEDYLFTLPSMHLEGLIPPPPYPELDGHTFMQSSSGFTARIEYSGKGWLKGKKNSFTASLYPTGKDKDIFYTAEGQWTEKFSIHDVKNKSVIEMLNTSTSATTPLTVAPLDQQSPLESRRAWRDVVGGIEANDMDAVVHAKSKIENEQREMRKREAADGTEWRRKYFKKVERHERAEELGRTVAYRPEGERTGGIWVWDSQALVGEQSEVLDL